MADVKQQIRKILSIANDDAASEQEVQNALAIAAKLMDRHHLSEEDLQTSPEDQEQDARTAPRTKQSVHGDNVKMPQWEKTLARTVAAIVGGVGYYCHASAPLTTPAGLPMRDGRGNQLKASTIVFYGIAEDVETATRLWNELRLAISALARLRYGSVARGDGAAYAEGFVAGVEEKRKERAAAELSEARHLTYTGTSTAMVLVERRNALIQQKHELAREWLASPAGGSIRLGKTSGGGSSGSSDARGQGRTDGSKYNASASRTKKLC
jgi:hypothetical protein